MDTKSLSNYKQMVSLMLPKIQFTSKGELKDKETVVNLLTKTKSGLMIEFSNEENLDKAGLIAKVVNYIQSCLDLISESDFTLDYKQKLEKVLTSLPKNLEKVNVEKASSKTNGEVDFEAEGEKLEKQIDYLAGFGSTIPVLKGMSGVMLAPVVFKPSRVVSESQYSQAGFKVDVVDSIYASAHNQMLLIINVSSIKKKLGLPMDTTLQEILNEVKKQAQMSLDALSHKLNKKLVFVQPNFVKSKHNKSYAFFWVMESRALSSFLFVKAAPVSIKSWGLPF